MTHILDFCGHCGVLLPSGFGLRDKLECENCGGLVKDRSSRIQGDFSPSEATRLLLINFGEGQG